MIGIKAIAWDGKQEISDKIQKNQLENKYI